MEKVTMTVHELAEMVGCSLPKAYALTDIAGFPVIRIGRRKVVLVEQTMQWLIDQAGRALL